MMRIKGKTVLVLLIAGVITLGGGLLDCHEVYAQGSTLEKKDLTIQHKGPSTVMLDNARITIEPNAKIRLTGVKSEEGGRVRLEANGITVEVTRLAVETGGDIVQVEATGDGERFIVRNMHKAKVRVGQIFLVGNTKTSDKTILKKIPLFPGQVLDFQSLKTSEKNLEGLNATVTVVDTADSVYRDIVIKVKE